MPPRAPVTPPATRPLACLSDIHGNLEALDAVLRELARRAITDIYVAGDHLFGGDAPHEVWLRLTQARAHLARGTSDLALASLDPAALRPKDDAERARLALFAKTRAAVGEIVIARLRRLPERIRVPLMDGSELLVVHGSPSDPTVELSHDLDDDELLALVGDDPADLVVCGASHTPFQRQLEQVRILNVGSVGQAPEGRVAHYAVLTPRPDGTLVEEAFVTY
jgi:predicted phosphodiesterase